MSKWINYESTCTHGGYGVCHEGCKVSGIWELDSEGEPSRFIAQCLWLKDLPLIAAAPSMAEVLEFILTENNNPHLVGREWGWKVLDQARGQS